MAHGIPKRKFHKEGYTLRTAQSKKLGKIERKEQRQRQVDALQALWEAQEREDISLAEMTLALAKVEATALACVEE